MTSRRRQSRSFAKSRGEDWRRCRVEPEERERIAWSDPGWVLWDGRLALVLGTYELHGTRINTLLLITIAHCTTSQPSSPVPLPVGEGTEIFCGTERLRSDCECRAPPRSNSATLL